MSKCWVFYAILTARVIFTAITFLDKFSLGQGHVWTFSVLLRTELFEISVFYNGSKEWNDLPEHIRAIDSIEGFKKGLNKIGIN